MNTIKHIQEPEDKKRGLYIITYIDENCNEFTSHVTKTGLELAKIKDKLQNLKYNMKLIDEFEDCIRDEQRESDSFNV